MHMKGNIAAIVLVVLGVFFLLTNLGRYEGHDVTYSL